MWEFGVILMIATMTNNSLFLIGLNGVTMGIGVLFSMDPIGKWLDANDRLDCVWKCLIVKLASVTLGYSLCATLMSSQHQDGSILQPVESWWLYIFPVLCSIAHISFSTIVLCIEKDWIPVLSDGDGAWLANTNATMTQIDMICKSIAPFVAGWIYVSFTHVQSALILLVTNIATVLLMRYFITDVHSSWPPLSRVRRGNTPAGVKTEAETGSLFRAFTNSGCALVMISFSFLYFTVLSFGSLMTVYLRSKGVADQFIGAARGVSGLAGLLGAVIFPICVSNFGLWKTGIASVWSFSILVIFAACTFAWSSEPSSEGWFNPTMMLMYSVTVSRVFLWLFDIVVRQIAQEIIPEEVRGQTNSQWRALYSTFDMAASLSACVWHQTEDFWLLSTLSASFVVIAACLFTMAYGMGAVNRQEYELVPSI